MSSKKTLLALFTAAALSMLGASAALASDRDDSASGPQAQRDWVEWQRSLGHTVHGNGYANNGRTAFGFAAPHAPRRHVGQAKRTAQKRGVTPGYYDYGYGAYGQSRPRGARKPTSESRKSFPAAATEPRCDANLQHQHERSPVSP